jgi:RNA polymerase sigma-54 factor
MGLGPRLDLRHSQQLVMTPQLQQAIKLLTLTNLELESFIVGEIEKNPLLEAQASEASEGPALADEPGGGADDGGEGGGEGGDGTDDGFDAADPATADRLMVAGDAVADAPLDVDYVAETYHHDSGSDQPAQPGLDGGLGLNGGPSPSAGGELPDGFEAILSEEQSLHDVLTAQAGAALEGADLVIAQHLIDMIDDAGYLEGSLADVAARLATDAAHVEQVLKVIQTFEPTGVGARSLAECLAIQAREADRCDPAMARLLDNLHLLARGDMAALRRICGVDQEDLTDMIRELRTYNPKPGLAYGGERPQTVVPDIYVARTPAGGWAVELNSATLPKLLVNRSYYVELAAGTKAREARSYLSDCLASANWLVKALDQRARTIVKVATELVRQQQAFFEHGVNHLKPLNLRTIAEAIGMHESTVSRVTSNKYLSCDRGLFELKYFFTSAIQSADGDEAVSSEAVKTRIRALIAAETADTILSDDKLVEVLRGEGFDIARRTVAKYREAMGLGSSVQRRRAALLNGACAA